LAIQPAPTQLAPFLGIGYNNISVDSPGFHLFADAGVMIGKYDATMTTNLIGSQNVTTADVDTEMNNCNDPAVSAHIHGRN
jgi:hypothetical protein